MTKVCVTKSQKKFFFGFFQVVCITYVSGIGYDYIVHSPCFFKFSPEFIFCVICWQRTFFFIFIWNITNIVSGIWDPGDFWDFSGISGIWLNFPGFPGSGIGIGIWFLKSGIWDWDWDLILKIWDLGLGFGIGFENLGSGIGIWDSFTKNPGFGIPGSQIADPWLGSTGNKRGRGWS